MKTTKRVAPRTSPGSQTGRSPGIRRPSKGADRAGPPAGGRLANRAAPAGKRRRPGRPRGSVSLTADLEEKILSYIRAGGLPHVAAEAAGVNPRTFRDWMARGEGRHPTRPSTPRLRRFAKAVNEAVGQTRLIAEARMFKDHPGQWLKTAARTRGDFEGWSDPEREGGTGSAELSSSALSRFTDEELDNELRKLALLSAQDGTFDSPPCPDPKCPCFFHEVWNAWPGSVRGS
jgi:hypothetical protein